MKAVSGEDNLEQGAVGYYGYGFVFRDYKHSAEPYIVTRHSSKVCGVGAYFGITEKVLQLDKIKDINELVRYDEKYDCLYGGALKTLLPTLEFGGNEFLFDVWVFVKTPDGKQFPATFYYGPSGTGFGGWHYEMYEVIFPKSFTHLINASPFDFDKNELEGLSEAIECALKKVPLSDFYGVYHHDLGNCLMGLKGKVPFMIELGNEYDEIDIDFYLDEIEYFKDQ
ncbi:MAG: hypothetical protein ACFE8J_07125 [Candidatus Heimdallarchaeota archaeon]